MPLSKASIDLIRERVRAEAEAAEAAQAAEEAEAAAQPERPRDAAVAAAKGLLVRAKGTIERIREKPSDAGEELEAAAPAPQTSIHRLRERIANFGDRPEPAVPDQRPWLKVVARAGDWIKSAAARIALMRERLAKPAPSAEPDAPVESSPVEAAAGARGWRTPAAAALFSIPVLAVVSLVLVDPWAGKGCPNAVDQGADCSRFGVAGRTFSALALQNVYWEVKDSQWATARADLKPILYVRPNFALALGARGDVESALGDKTAALADFDRALALTPSDLTTRANRAQLYQSLGMTKQAAADFAFIYHADPSTHKWAEVVAFVRQIDHSTEPPKVHKHSKRRHRPSVEAGPPPEPSPPPAEQPPQTSPSGDN